MENLSRLDSRINFVILGNQMKQTLTKSVLVLKYIVLVAGSLVIIDDLRCNNLLWHLPLVSLSSVYRFTGTAQFYSEFTVFCFFLMPHTYILSLFNVEPDFKFEAPNNHVHFNKLRLIWEAY